LRLRRLVTRPLAAAAVVSMSTLSISAPAAADELVLSFEDAVVFGQPGQQVVVEESPVEAALVGTDCTAAYTAANNTSVRQGTDLVITSGDQQIEILGVEDEAGATVAAEGSLTLSDSIEIAVRLGPEARASLSGSLVLDCAVALPPGTTTTIPGGCGHHHDTARP
jgi:hypothetical protein